LPGFGVDGSRKARLASGSPHALAMLQADYGAFLSPLWLENYASSLFGVGCNEPPWRSTYVFRFG
jgi:hypothetical protein